MPMILSTLMHAFDWFEEGQQRSLQAAGWPALSKPETLVMMFVQTGVVRPADIARGLRLTRQAVHSTIATLVGRELLALAADPRDARIKIAQLTDRGRAMAADADSVADRQIAQLRERIGGLRVLALTETLSVDWGQPVRVEL